MRCQHAVSSALPSLTDDESQQLQAGCRTCCWPVTRAMADSVLSTSCRVAVSRSIPGTQVPGIF